MKNLVLMHTIIGEIGIAAEDERITNLYWGESIPKELPRRETRLLKQARQELAEYFSGKRKVFDLPLAPTGTEFQKRVWQALTQIPYGETVSYQEIAKRINQAKAARAVGGANNKNPIPIIIPCHRVIGANGKLVGYGGGLAIKRCLLDLEAGKTRKTG